MGPRPLPSALLAAGALALGVFLGGQVGPAALVLCIPGAVLSALLASGRQARERHLVELSRRDPLTGLGNARLLHERLSYEISRHERHRRPLAVLMCDLDGFKSVNDRFGHAAGDEVLQAVATALARTVRDEDTVVRQGGDEFCVLAPETGQAEADQLTDRLRQAVADAVGGLDGVSGSFGAAVFPADGRTGPALLGVADERAFVAKRRGRGRAVSRAAA